MQIKYNHTPVMLEEVIDGLNIKSGQSFVDCTLGGGGYTQAILEKVGEKGRVLAVDLDKIAIRNAKKNFKNKENLILAHDNFRNLSNIVKNNFGKNVKVDGVVMDLGLSSAQLDDKTRGFSFRHDGPIDMHFGENSTGDSVETIINKYSERELADIIKKYGEERFAFRIAKRIVEKRKDKDIKTSKELAEIIKEAIPKRFQGKIHPATKTFQALRIESNKELESLEKVLPQAIEILKPGGRIVAVSFHSLEDRIVKHFFRKEAKDCLCPSSVPVCVCDHTKKLKIITKKPMVPSDDEIENNPRARSAKLRIAEIV